MPNCTAYAYARACELLGKEPNLSSGSANERWEYNINKKVYPYGHVAVVEEINDSIITF